MNTPGSYRCDCKEGYRNVDDYTCESQYRCPDCLVAVVINAGGGKMVVGVVVVVLVVDVIGVAVVASSSSSSFDGVDTPYRFCFCC